LIDEALNAKICDFGLVRLIQGNGSPTGLTTTSHTGTARYLAYELVEYGEMPTTASDVHALGCIGLEVSFREIYSVKLTIFTVYIFANSICTNTKR
jgi:serine/threonine protein kinase